MIGQTITHYKILEKVGVGGMGEVYKAQDIKLDRLVALKFLPPGLTRDLEAKQRFIHEAKAVSTLQHPNICVVYDIDETDGGQMFISMEFLEGETLQKLIERGPLRIEQALDIAIQVAQGLAEAHHHAIVHRDLKPANILLRKRGTAKIVDFGLAKSASRQMLTTPGTILGTAAYMSPEQATGEQTDVRTDIWSLGVVLYEMITGQRPFRGDYENAVVYSILNVQPEPITALRTAVPMDLERIVGKCLSKDPRERYQHMDELLVDLHSCAKSTASAPARDSSPPGPGVRRTFQYAAVGAGLLALVAVTYMLLPREGAPTPRLKKIAVLPFENLGPADDEYFADGLSEEIASRLSSIRGLGVISRTSSIQYKKTSKSLPVIGKELGVDYILEGTIRWEKLGSIRKVRITPELIQISQDTHLWADNMDRTLDDIFAVQTEIATKVVKALDIVLTESQKRVVGLIPTRNVEAYQTYLRGLSFADRIERPNIETAITMFHRAVELDSTFALAYTQLGMAHLYYFWFGFDPSKERLALAKEAIDRSFALQGDLPSAYTALGAYYLFSSRDYDRALAALRSAEEKDPNNAKALELVAYIWRRQGKFEDAVQQLKKVCELDPQNAVPVSEIGNTLRMLGRYPEAEAYCDRAISLTPDLSDPYLWKATISLLWHGDTKASRAELEQVPKQYEYWVNLIWLDIYDRNYQSALDRLTRAPVNVFEDNRSFTPTSQLRGMVYRLMGDPVRSRAAFDSARVVLESEVKRRPDDYRPHMSMGIVNAGLGRRDEAVREAKLAVNLLPVSRDAWAGVYPVIVLSQVYAMVGMNDAARDELAYLLSCRASKEITVAVLRLDPIYDTLRNDPGFQALLTKYQ